MIKEYQVTLICESGKYKPVSCIVKKDDKELAAGQQDFVRKLKADGITKICHKRYWTSADLKKYGYTRIKVREYNKEKIKKENAERYEAIKEAKYASGEWKRPKEKN